MKRLNSMALAVVAAGLLVSGRATAQVEVEAGGTKVEVGADGQVDVDAAGTKVRTGADGVDVEAGETRVRTKAGRPAVRAGGGKGGVTVKVGLDGRSGALAPRRALRCVDNQELTLDGVVIDGAGPVVQASGNCVLTLKNSVIKDNAEVTLVNCTVRAKLAAALTENGALKVQRSVVEGKTKVDDAAEIDKDDASVFKP